MCVDCIKRNDFNYFTFLSNIIIFSYSSFVPSFFILAYIFDPIVFLISFILLSFVLRLPTQAVRLTIL